MCACQWGWKDVAQELIDNQCNIHKAMKVDIDHFLRYRILKRLTPDHSQDGTTALFLATQNGFTDLVQLLIDECRHRKRNVGILVAAPRKDGASPLFIAAQMGYLECVKMLIANGAEVDQSRIVRNN